MRWAAIGSRGDAAGEHLRAPRKHFVAPPGAMGALQDPALVQQEPIGRMTGIEADLIDRIAPQVFTQERGAHGFLVDQHRATHIDDERIATQQRQFGATQYRNRARHGRGGDGDEVSRG